MVEDYEQGQIPETRTSMNRYSDGIMKAGRIQNASQVSPLKS
jgi:hypothetical protein